MENLKSEWVFRRSLTRWNLTVPFIGMFTHDFDTLIWPLSML